MSNALDDLKPCPFCGEHLVQPYPEHLDVFRHPYGTDCFAGKAIVYPETYGAWNARAAAMKGGKDA